MVLTRLGLLAELSTSWQSWKICENSAHMVVLRFRVLVDVIWSAE